MIAVLLAYMLRVDWALQARLAVARATPAAGAEDEEEKSGLIADHKVAEEE
eukprot:SAG22_NODE_16323_length_328_cov_0.655022_2_plen_51_part_00